jgi:hypothetical protein
MTGNCNSLFMETSRSSTAVAAEDIKMSINQSIFYSTGFLYTEDCVRLPPGLMALFYYTRFILITAILLPPFVISNYVSLILLPCASNFMQVLSYIS